MTPTSIKTGRALSYVQGTVSVVALGTGAVAPADGNRVGMALALAWDSAAALAALNVSVGIVQNGTFVPVTTLNQYHPACWLDVSHLGPLITAPFAYLSLGDETGTIGVTQLRQIQELE